MTSSDNQVIYTPITHHLFPPFFNVVNKTIFLFTICSMVSLNRPTTSIHIILNSPIQT